MSWRGFSTVGKRPPHRVRVHRYLNIAYRPVKRVIGSRHLPSVCTPQPILRQGNRVFFNCESGLGEEVRAHVGLLSDSVGAAAGIIGLSVPCLSGIPHFWVVVCNSRHWPYNECRVFFRALNPKWARTLLKCLAEASVCHSVAAHSFALFGPLIWLYLLLTDFLHRNGQVGLVCW